MSLCQNHKNNSLLKYLLGKYFSLLFNFFFRNYQLKSNCIFRNGTFTFVSLATIAMIASVIILMEKYNTWKFFKSGIGLQNNLEHAQGTDR